MSVYNDKNSEYIIKINHQRCKDLVIMVVGWSPYCQITTDDSDKMVYSVCNI